MYQLAKATMRFKEYQLGSGDYNADDFKAAKDDLNRREKELRVTLDELQRKWSYSGVNESDWENDYLPFHWVSEFYAIIAERGGFDIIIGNPPYVEKRKVTYDVIGYDTFLCGNLYAYICEKALSLLNRDSKFGMILPISSISSDRAMPFQQLMSNKSVWASTYSNRPAKLFYGVEQRLVIFLILNLSKGSYFNASYKHWSSVERDNLISLLFYENNANQELPAFTKIGKVIENSIFHKLIYNGIQVSNLVDTTSGDFPTYFHDGPTYWIRSMTFNPREGYESDRSNHYKELQCCTQQNLNLLVCLLNSSLFYLYFKAMSNCRDFSAREVGSFLLAEQLLHYDFENIATQLMTTYIDNRVLKSRNYPSGVVEYYEYLPKFSKPIIDQIDTILAQHYGFTEEELDYIINYDIKYRMGVGGGSDANES